jgi:ATP-dependent Clp protease ATP-binding subunit ClpC
MFERYTEKARRVIFFARYEASEFGAQSIETEHILLGLLREDRQLVEQFLKSPRRFLDAIRKEIENRTGLRDKVPASVDMPLSPGAKRVLSLAAEESDRMGHRHIGTEHLLLGILREEKSLAAQILYERGLRLDQVREEVDSFHETEQRTAQEIELESRVTDVKTVCLERRFTRLVNLLVSKGVIGEDEKMMINTE